MLPRLCSELDTRFFRYTYLGTLTHCRKCDIREVRNGAYTLEIETTVNDDCADMIRSQLLIEVKPNPFDGNQIFEIQKTRRTINGLIYIEAKHIKCLCFSICTNSYGATADDPISFSGTPQQVWNELVNNNISVNVPFQFYTATSPTDSSAISTVKTFYSGLSVSNSLGNILGGQEGSFLDTWGGEFKWDNLNIYYYLSRGSTKNYKIQYGQNVSDASQSESCENTFTHIQPYAWYNTDSGAKVSLSASPVAVPNSQATYTKTYILDCSDVLSPYIVGPASIGTQTITSAQARNLIVQYAQTYAKYNGLGNLNINIEVTIRAELDDMSQIGLCDTVNVILDNFGTEVTAKITEVIYDALNERWKKMVIGSPKITVADFILSKSKYLNENK